MKLTTFCSIAVLLLCCSFGTAAGNFKDLPSFQGYTGLLNTPNASVTDQGRLDMVFTDQVEEHRRQGRDGAENYIMSFGLLPGFEFGARLTEESPEGMRDLSANTKLRIPRSFFFDNDYLPDMAIGFQDLGGGASHLQTRYLVLSSQFDFLRLSAGYGDGTDRMDGVFGGAELRVTNWLYLVGENDTKETNMGLKLVTPEDLLPIPADLGITAKTSLDHDPGDFNLAFSLSIPLGSSRHSKEPISLPQEIFEEPSRPDKTSASKVSTDKVSTDKATARDGKKTKKSGGLSATAANGNSAPATGREADVSAPGETRLRQLKQHLADLGFENLEVGIQNRDVLYIAYENNRYNHNELDGLGLVLGAAVTRSPSDLTAFNVVIKEINTPMLTVRSSISAYKAFLSNAKRFTPYMTDFFLSQFEITPPEALNPTDLRLVQGPDNPSRFKTRISLYPGVKSLLGTEVGVYDYLLSAKISPEMHLWKGAAFHTRFDVPVAWSDDFEDEREDAKLDQLMFHQSFKLTSNIMTMVSAGMYDEDNDGVLNETFWSSLDGKHKFKVKLGYFEDDNIDLEREIWLGSYRYYLDRLDLFLEGTYGKYWYQDKAGYFKMKRFFGDTAVELFYRHMGTGTGERAAGLRVRLPLTPRRDMNPSLFQIKGADQWSYGHQTTIASDGERNPINRNIAVIPVTSHSLDRVYYNRDRLNRNYITKHIFRLRDAYMKWGEKEE